MTASTPATIKAILFDLDGTLVDTAKDFVRIIHELAEENNWTPPTDEIIREQVSAGSKAMVSLFSNDGSADKLLVNTPHSKQLNKQLNKQFDATDEQTIETLRQAFLDRYEADICVDSELFAGLETLLEQIENASIPWGVVTNKPRYLAEKLIEQLGLSQRCAVLVCPEDVSKSKPDPEPMYLAMSQLNLTKQDASSVIYIGDHIRDIQSGNSAGNITILAGYGYISAKEKQSLTSWQADHIVHSSADLVDLVGLLLKAC